MFKNFDFKLLSEPDFKEDSVREELILPIIKKLGYAVSGDSRIIRSKSLVHPYVAIGSQNRKISIIPDYIFTSNGKPYWVLDAKSPREDITKSKHVEQAYSYAIHPEIRVQYYALCNGYKFILYSVRQFDPLIEVNLSELHDEKWEYLYKILNPNIKADPAIVDFYPDYGLLMLRYGCKPGFMFIGSSINSSFISKVEDGLYTTMSIILGDVKCIISLDFAEEQFQQLLKLLPTRLAEKLSNGLKRQPYSVLLKDEEFKFGVVATASNQIESNNNEQFLPFIVQEFTEYKDFKNA